MAWCVCCGISLLSTLYIFHSGFIPTPPLEPLISKSSVTLKLLNPAATSLFSLDLFHQQHLTHFVIFISWKSFLVFQGPTFFCSSSILSAAPSVGLLFLYHLFVLKMFQCPGSRHQASFLFIFSSLVIMSIV